MGMELSDQKKGYKADYGRGSFPTCKKYEQERNNRFKIAQEREFEKKKEEQANNLYSNILKNATDDFFKKNEEKIKWKDKIRISDNGKDDSFNDAILEYLDTLENDNRRIEACNNIVKICRNISVQLQTIKEV